MTPTLPSLQAFSATVMGAPDGAPKPMAGGGSDRLFYRFRAGTRSWVGVLSGHAPELRAFLAFTAHFAAADIPVPVILGADPAHGLYLMEDLGEDSLAARLQHWRAEPGGGARALEAVRNVVQWLPVIQVRGGRDLDYSLCFEGQELGRAAFEADAAHFLAEYVPRFVLRPGPDAAVRADLARLMERLDAVPRAHFCYRDFQCRNIMWPRGAPVFLDYQAGRRGPLPYDLVSLLYSPDTGLAEAERDLLVADYLEALAGEGVRVEREPFLRDYYAFVLVRRMQALGAYARIAVSLGKSDYLAKISPAVRTLRDLLARGRFALGLPALEAWLRDVLDAATVH